MDTKTEQTELQKMSELYSWIVCAPTDNVKNKSTSLNPYSDRLALCHKLYEILSCLVLSMGVFKLDPFG